MKEKLQLQEGLPTSLRPPTSRCMRLIYLYLLIMMAAWLSAIASYQFFRNPSIFWDLFPQKKALNNTLPGTPVIKIPFEAHIMSKCPDARDCLQQLVVPAMENISDKVAFNLSYIGRADPRSDDAVSCMHGPSECLGNMILLCAATLYPDPKLHLGFANCMISEFRNIPQQGLVEGCAMEHGLAFEKINRCISDEGTGSKLLYDSVARSERNNITKSCTVRLNGNIRCIRDGGQWKDCENGSSVEALVRDVEQLYDEVNQ